MGFQVVESKEVFAREQKQKVVLYEHGHFKGVDLPEEWDGEPDPEDTFDAERVFVQSSELVNITPSLFTEFAVKLPDKQKNIFVPFSFDARRYLRQIYDTPFRRTLLKCGRQVEKSTLLGNKLLAYSCIITSLNSLYVSPTNMQTKVFSQDRLKEPIETSDFLKSWTTTKLSDNVFLKKFINRSQITLRYAYLNADRSRGIPADILCIDELQDILVDNIPVLEECASHSELLINGVEVKGGYFIYSGTPKSLDNTLEYYWSNYSTQNEWAVPCHRHAISTGGLVTKAHWNILGEDNIGTKSLVCDRCGKSIVAMDPESQWISMNPQVIKLIKKPYEGYRIPQLMVPWVPFDDILQKRSTYSQSKFWNEVLGLSYDTGTRPLTQQDVRDNCDNNFALDEHFLRDLKGQIGESIPIYAGIDWGTGENTYTVLCLGGYIGSKFTIFYWHRFEGQEIEPEIQLAKIAEIISGWKVKLVGCDYGGGFDRNDKLIRMFGWQRVTKYQYSTPREKVKWEDGLKRWLVHRTEVMSDIFNAIKRRDVFRLPGWESFQAPFGSDFLNIFSEYSETARMNEYKKSPGCTDDAFHALLYCFLASMVHYPRPDVISPMSTASTS